MTPIGKIEKLLDIPELAVFSDNPSSWFTERDDIKKLIAVRIAAARSNIGCRFWSLPTSGAPRCWTGTN